MPAGRFPSGRVMPPDPDRTHAYPVRPSAASPPAPAGQGPAPRTGGRTQQGARQRARSGGRTQQGIQGGAQVQPAPPPAPAAQAPAPAPPGPAATRQAASSPASGASGAFCALLGYPLVLNLLRGGPARMWQWVRAKAINQPGSAGSVPPGAGEAGGGTISPPGTVPGHAGAGEASGGTIRLPAVPASRYPVFGSHGRVPP